MNEDTKESLNVGDIVYNFKGWKHGERLTVVKVTDKQFKAKADDQGQWKGHVHSIPMACYGASVFKKKSTGWKLEVANAERALRLAQDDLEQKKERLRNAELLEDSQGVAP